MLEGKTAVITGSTSGIGLAIARNLASQKASVVLNGFGDAAEIEKLCADIGHEHGVRVLFDGADLSKPGAAAHLIEIATDRFGQVDILVNNAGTTFKAPVETYPPEQWDAILALNLSAPFHAIRAVLPQMRRRNWGRIVNIASGYGLVGGAGRVAYVASKHGLVGLTKAVALETADSGITCNAVCPGMVATRYFYKSAKDLAQRDNITREEAQSRLAGTFNPSGRPIAPEQVAQLVAYLCSDAASEIRGAAMAIDAGWTAQ